MDPKQRPTYGGITPLMMAALRGNLEVVKVLLAAGADVNMKDHKGKTAVDYALLRRNYDVAEYLETIRRRVVKRCSGTPLILWR